MVTMVKKPDLMWLAPSPLWGERTAWMRLPEQTLPDRPVILRFANDMFMDEMMAMLTHSPWRFAEWVARDETWRDPMPTPKPVEITRPPVHLPDTYNKTRQLVQQFDRDNRVARIKTFTRMPGTVPDLSKDEPLKLYQATHQRFYVVTGSLVSCESRFPDHMINLAGGERATFVIRALVDTEKGRDEYGFVATPTGMAWRSLGRHAVDNAGVRRVLPNEERLPLFPVTYPDLCDRFRQVFGGLIPVGKRDEWIDAPPFDGRTDTEIASPVPSRDGGVDHFREILYTDVIAPWKALIEQAETEKRKNAVSGDSFSGFTWNESAADLALKRNLRTARDQIQTASWYLLHDFAVFLRDHLPTVWTSLSGTSSGALEPVLNSDEQALVSALSNTRIDSRLFLRLAVENLAVGGFESEPGVNLWERLIDLWKLEIYLKLAAVFHETAGPAEKLRARVAASNTLSHPFKNSFITLIDTFRATTAGTFLDFARWFGERYATLKNAAVKGTTLSSSTNEGRLVRILKDLKLPMVQIDVYRAVRSDVEDAVEISKSLWDLLAFFWNFEEYVDRAMDTDVSGVVSAWLRAGKNLEPGVLNDQILEWIYGYGDSGTWYSFLRFAGDLETVCPRLHTAAMFEAFGRTEPLDTETQDLITVLRDTEITRAVHNALYYPNAGKRSIRIISTLPEALKAVLDWSRNLDDVDTPYDRNMESAGDVTQIDDRWPDFLFPLTDPDPALTLATSHTLPLSDGSESDAEALQSTLDDLADRVDALVKIEKELMGFGTSATLNLKPLLTAKHPRFVVRFVFERPHCGNLFQPLVSPATVQLEMAPFFDPDAPARSVRIRMPLDISPAGLRKYKKNAMFLMSDMMCGKVKKARKLTLADLVLSVLPWPFHKDLPDIGNTGPCRSGGDTLGMFCSLSIPIVTLCALVLLTIMVSLFNIFFKWIPWFFMCFPLPGVSNMKAKD